MGPETTDADDSGEWDGQEGLHFRYVLSQIPLASQAGKGK